jgi:hypothetical protein
MNGAHYHLLVNHVSLFALIIGTAAFAASMYRKSTDLRLLAVVLFVLAGVFGWISHQTGDMAYDVVKELPGVVQAMIDEHDDAAHWAVRSGYLVAVLAIAMEWAVRKKPKWAKALQWILLLAALFSCTIFMRTAFLGGLIRHTEIR